MIGARIFIVAHADQRRVEEPDERRECRLALRMGSDRARKVGRHPLADAWQRGAELEHPLELVGVARNSPFSVIPVLLATVRIAARRLQVAVRTGADPHLLVSWRNGELADPLQLRRVADQLAVGPSIDEAFAVAHAPDTGAVVADVDEPRRHAIGPRQRWGALHRSALAARAIEGIETIDAARRHQREHA